LVEVAKNDGLGIIDFAIWFAGSNAASSKRKPFNGQILCWNDAVDYCSIGLQTAQECDATEAK
jgi:hypothetical protein